MSEQTGSQTVDTQQASGGLSEEQYQEVMRSFGYEPKAPQDKSESAADDEQEDVEDEKEDSEDAPATEQPKIFKKVKHNKKEVEILEDQVDELLQKGLALDKERERKSELEKSLQRAAKLHGYDSVDDYLANLDEIENKAVKQKEDAFSELKKKLLTEAEEHGLDPALFEEFLESHPLLTQAREAVDREKKSLESSKKKEQEQSQVESWNKLFTKYPQLADELNEGGSEASWLTPEMVARIQKGYDPIDAYELVHRDRILEEERQRTKQQVLKENRLNKRASVEKNASNAPEEEVPDAVKGAFAMFGLDPRTAKKYMK